MGKILSLAEIKKIDKSDMLNKLYEFPLQLKEALEIVRSSKILFTKRSFNKIVFTGVGGSAIGVELVRDYLAYKSKLPIIVSREYDIPSCVDGDTLVFVSSYSGNTEEAISVYKEARSTGACIIVISSGGKLKEYAEADNFTFIAVPGFLPPRCALGYSSIIPLCILSKIGLVGKVDSAIKEAVQVLESLRDKELKFNIKEKNNIAKYIAARLVGNLAVIYSASAHFGVAATRLRGQINENSKSLAMSHLFPEMNHNEISGWYHPRKLFKNLRVLMLRDKLVHQKTNKRMDLTRDMLKKDNIEVFEIWSRGSDLLGRIFSLLYIGDYISYYLAIYYGVDPTPTDRIDHIKDRLSRI